MGPKIIAAHNSWGETFKYQSDSHETRIELTIEFCIENFHNHIHVGIFYTGAKPPNTKMWSIS